MRKRKYKLTRIAYKLDLLETIRLEAAEKKIASLALRTKRTCRWAWGMSLAPLPVMLAIMANEHAVRLLVDGTRPLLFVTILSALWNVYFHRPFPARQAVTILGGMAFAIGMFLPALVLRNAGPVASGALLYSLTLLFVVLYTGAVYVIGASVRPVMIRMMSL